jgi:YggT family protein
MIESNPQQRQTLNLSEQKRFTAAANQNSTTGRLVNNIYFLFSIIEALLAMRLILHLLAANLENSFATVINGLSFPFVAVFARLLQNPALSAASVLEITTLIAMLVYAILAWFIGCMVWLTQRRARYAFIDPNTQKSEIS